jgi:hypothetical protein
LQVAKYREKSETQDRPSVLLLCSLTEEILFMIWSFKNQTIWIFGLSLILCLLAPTIPSFADEDERFHGRGMRNGQLDGSRGSEGGELGGLAAWLFGIANFPVVLSMLLKAAAKILPEKMGLAEKIRTVNQRQKKYLMNLHYWVNPLAFGVAFVHFLSSECKSTAMPELGMGAMLVVSILGLMMTLRLSPPSVRRFVFKFHTNPLITIVVFTILLIGHSVIE